MDEKFDRYWKVRKLFREVTSKKDGKWSIVTSGRWSNNLRTLDVTTGARKGQTFSGGKNVGTKFSEIITGNPSMLSWC